MAAHHSLRLGELKRVIKGLYVNQLRELLKAGGWVSSGVKAVLVERIYSLLEALSPTSAVYQDTMNRIENFVNQNILKSSSSSVHSHRWEQPAHTFSESNNAESKLEVVYKQSPFCSLIYRLVPPSLLDNTGERPKSFNFSIPPENIPYLRNSLCGVYPQQKVYIRCAPLLATKAPCEDQYPQFCNIKVNRNIIELPARVVNRVKKGHNRPIDITQYLFPDPNRSYDSSFNFLEFLTMSVNSYVVAVELVQRFSVPDLCALLPLTEEAEVKTEWKNFMAQSLNSDILTTHTQLSLVCPLGKMQISLPGKSRNCKHLQCFDMTTFLSMNERRETWICPVCNISTPFDTLFIDQHYQTILQNVSSNITQIIVTPEGDWAFCPPKDTLDVSDSQSDFHPVKLSEPRSTPAPVEVIDLSDDDDPVTIPTSATTTATTSTATSTTDVCLENILPLLEGSSPNLSSQNISALLENASLPSLHLPSAQNIPILLENASFYSPPSHNISVLHENTCLPSQNIPLLPENNNPSSSTATLTCSSSSPSPQNENQFTQNSDEMDSFPSTLYPSTNCSNLSDDSSFSSTCTTLNCSSLTPSSGSFDPLSQSQMTVPELTIALMNETVASSNLQASVLIDACASEFMDASFH
eukprot:Sdes_comp19902_c0_seq1m12289